MKTFLLGLCLAAAALAQTAVYPNALAGDSQLKIRKNFVATNLVNGIAAGDTLITVRDASRIEAHMLLTVDQEIVLVTAKSGNNLTVTRAQDNTTAASHRGGASIGQWPTAYDVNALAAELKAVQSTLGTNLSNVATVASNSWLPSTVHDWTQTPGGSLSVGVNVVTLTPCPAGVAGANADHELYISGGVGSAEKVLITGGTCTSGASSGTINFTAANTHSGAWTIASATAGIREALTVARTNRKPVVVYPGTHTVRSTIELTTGDSIFCSSELPDRWHSGVYACHISYTGTGDLFNIDGGSSPTIINSISVRGLSLNSTTGRYAISIDATGGGAVTGLVFENVSVGDGTGNNTANGWTRAVNSAGVVFDVTLRRFSATDTTGNLISIRNGSGGAVETNQWKILDSYLIPTAAGTWCVAATGSAAAEMIGTIEIINTTCAPAASIASGGANGYWIHGALTLIGGLLEGLPNGAAGITGTVGLRISGTIAAKVIGTPVLTFGKNIQIGDSTNPTWGAYNTEINTRSLAGATNDVEVVAGGSRIGTSIKCVDPTCVVSNLRESTDSIYNEVQLLHAWGTTVDMRGVNLAAGAGTFYQRGTGTPSQVIVRNNPLQDTAPDYPAFLFRNAAGTDTGWMNVDGTLKLGLVNFADLKTTGKWSENGTVLLCPNCTAASSPCTGGGSGALAVRVGGAWKCY